MKENDYDDFFEGCLIPFLSLIIIIFLIWLLFNRDDFLNFLNWFFEVW